ncbi:MAG: hypothetical protein WAW88_05285 [Nocardioides sp.]
MNETTLIWGIVLGAAAFLVLRFLPAGLKARIGLGGGGTCGAKSGCGSKGCDGCH